MLRRNRVCQTPRRTTSGAWPCWRPGRMRGVEGRVRRAGRGDQTAQAADRRSARPRGRRGVPARDRTGTLQQIQHPNLLISLGSGITGEGEPFLVTEFMELGSLRGVLADVGRVLAWAVRKRVAAEIAAGTVHLHSLKIVHRDLKSDNCLCDAELNTKIADFGTAKLVRAGLH